ncbi:MAG TPA: helix-turn-helix domain-containing protein [Planctomycetota bacterium]|nr:helix-turn-helix domain-containing protein [Planctomycetota bacterium]
MRAITGVFKALSNPNRLTVYQVICKAARRVKKGLTIEQICQETAMKQPAVSHHVAHLERAGLILRTKSRWWVHCTPSPEGVDRATRFLADPAGYRED